MLRELCGKHIGTTLGTQNANATRIVNGIWGLVLHVNMSLRLVGGIDEKLSSNS